MPLNLAYCSLIQAWKLPVFFQSVPISIFLVKSDEVPEVSDVQMHLLSNFKKKKGKFTPLLSSCDSLNKNPG